MKKIFYFIGIVVVTIISLSCSSKANVDDNTGGDTLADRVFSNNYHSLSLASKSVLSIERSTIYSPGDEDWHYAHHPSIAYFKGEFIAIFSNGINGEDEGGQRVLVATSHNFKEWSWKVLKDTDRKQVLTPGGLLVADEDLLVAYYTQNDFAESGRPNVRLHALTSSDGVTWSEPIDLGISTFPCHRPTRLKSGRLVLTGNREVFYTDDPTGVSEWKTAQKSNYAPGVKPSLVEGAIIECKDSTYILFRDTKGRTLLWQESSLTGESWSVPQKTKFTDNNTKSFFGKLPNGKTYYVGVPDTLKMGARTPLVLSISEDEFHFNKHYIVANDNYDIKYSDGRWKEGQFGYPYSIVHDNCIYIIVSRRKETIEAFKIPVDKIGLD